MRTCITLSIFLVTSISVCAAECVYGGDARGSVDDGVLCNFADEQDEAPPQPLETKRVSRKHQEGMLSPQEEQSVVRGLVTRYRNSGNVAGIVSGGTKPLGYVGRTRIVTQ